MTSPLTMDRSVEQSSEMNSRTDEAGSFFYVLEDPIRLLFADDDPILREFAVVHLSISDSQRNHLTVLAPQQGWPEKPPPAS